jgi:hypothetical protein
MLWEAAQWVGNFLETIGTVGAVLLIGALVAGAAFWIFRRTVGLLAKPESDIADEIDFGEATSTQPGDLDIISVTAEVPRKNPTGDHHEEKQG